MYVWYWLYMYVCIYVCYWCVYAYACVCMYVYKQAALCVYPLHWHFANLAGLFVSYQFWRVCLKATSLCGSVCKPPSISYHKGVRKIVCTYTHVFLNKRKDTNSIVGLNVIGLTFIRTGLNVIGLTFIRTGLNVIGLTFIRTGLNVIGLTFIRTGLNLIALTLE
jgi:hypothetical protein